jgi:hypothetical protein
LIPTNTHTVPFFTEIFSLETILAEKLKIWLIYNTENVSTLSLIFWGKKITKSGKKAEWEAEWATEKVDQLDTPVPFFVRQSSTKQGTNPINKFCQKKSILSNFLDFIIQIITNRFRWIKLSIRLCFKSYTLIKIQSQKVPKQLFLIIKKCHNIIYTGGINKSALNARQTF